MAFGEGKTYMRSGPAPDSMVPQFTGDELRKALSRYDRQPFMDVLAAWLECAPTPEEVMTFASKKPDMYIKAVSDLARLAGYTDKREVLINHRVKLETLSDSQLEDRARELASSLGITFPHQIDGDTTITTTLEDALSSDPGFTFLDVGDGNTMEDPNLTSDLKNNSDVPSSD